jgi:hypothetical protein
MILLLPAHQPLQRTVILGKLRLYSCSQNHYLMTYVSSICNWFSPRMSLVSHVCQNIQSDFFLCPSAGYLLSSAGSQLASPICNESCCSLASPPHAASRLEMANWERVLACLWHGLLPSRYSLAFVSFMTKFIRWSPMSIQNYIASWSASSSLEAIGSLNAMFSLPYRNRGICTVLLMVA